MAGCDEPGRSLGVGKAGLPPLVVGPLSALITFVIDSLEISVRDFDQC